MFLFPIPILFNVPEAFLLFREEQEVLRPTTNNPETVIQIQNQKADVTKTEAGDDASPNAETVTVSLASSAVPSTTTVVAAAPLPLYPMLHQLQRRTLQVSPLLLLPRQLSQLKAIEPSRIPQRVPTPTQFAADS